MDRGWTLLVRGHAEQLRRAGMWLARTRAPLEEAAAGEGSAPAQG
jgi:hypothetical protein